jgi:ATP-dependent protease HslVU (ClpYQ) peptidase subunit
MTVICALCEKASKEVWLGCNDGVTLGDTRMPGVREPKWQHFGSWAFGMAGSPLLSDLLETVRSNFPAKNASPLDIVRFLKAVFDEHELGSRDDDDTATSYPFSAVLAHRDGRIWDVDSYFAIAELQPGTLWARGSGMEYALGADFPLASCEVIAEERVRNAVEAAIHYDTGCPGAAIVERLT